VPAIAAAAMTAVDAMSHAGVPTYLITCHGAGGPPPSAEARDQMMAAFQAWVASAGDHMIDPGSPLGPSKTVSPEGVSDVAPAGHIGGYWLIKADDLDAAVGLVKSHPFVGRGGSLQSQRSSSGVTVTTEIPSSRD
jgi:hypothetical protein